MKKLNTLESVGLGKNDFKGISNREHDSAQLTLEKAWKRPKLEFEEVQSVTPTSTVKQPTIETPCPVSDSDSDEIQKLSQKLSQTPTVIEDDGDEIIILD